MNRHPHYGDQIAEATARDGTCVRIFAGGFEGTGPQGEVSSRWEDVAYVNRAHQRVTAVVLDMQFAHVEVGLLSGARFVFDGGDASAALCARLLAEHAMPYVVQRAIQQIQQGATVPFGPEVRVSPQGVEVMKGGRFIPLPATQIAGYKVVQGFCLIDVNPARPTLVAQLSLARMTNPDTFLALLGQLAPGKDLGERPYQVPGSAWRTSAATHDPRFVSTRTRLIGLVGIPGGLIGLLLLFVMISRAAACAYNAAGARWSDEEKGAFAKVVAAQVTAVEASQAPTQPLAKACEPWNSTDAVLAFTTPEAGVAGLPSGVARAYVLTHFEGWKWPPGEVPIPDTKRPMVIVVRLLAGTRIQPDGRAEVREHVRVANGKTGAVVCEGIAEGQWQPPTGKSADEGTRYGLVKLALMKMCKDGYYGVCDRALDWKDGITITDLPPAATATPTATATTSANAPSPKVKGKKR